MTTPRPGSGAIWMRSASAPNSSARHPAPAAEPVATSGACPCPGKGDGKHFTRDFEAFALTLMREMPMKKAGAILNENDTSLWRLLFKHVTKAYAVLDLFGLVHLGRR